MSTIFGFLNEKKPQQTTQTMENPKMHKFGPPRQPRIFLTIPEMDVIEETESGSTGMSRESMRVSFAKRDDRKMSTASGKSAQSGYKNDVDVEGNLQRGNVSNSVRSSTHGSVNSLPVIREQYCCCTRWTKLEKNLVTAVAILALVIVGLVVAVGILAGTGDGGDKTFTWSI